jgi:hypothetical protein
MKRINLEAIIVNNAQPLTATRTDLGNRINGELVFYLRSLANPKIGLINPKPVVIIERYGIPKM